MRLVLLIAVVLGACGPPSPGADASVVEVIDGDTLVVLAGGAREVVRLIGINAPERGECGADPATDRLAGLVSGAQVTLVRDVSDRDQFGRLLRYVRIGADDVGERLVREGLAVARRYPPDVDAAETYEAAEEAAREAGLGLWAEDPCGTGEAALRIADVHANAPGDDAANPNGEWVEVVNRSGEAVSLEGWGIGDESSRHRYTFPPGASLAPGGTVQVLSGCGEDVPGTFHWCADGPVWNNGGDTAFLTDSVGALVDTFSYP